MTKQLIRLTIGIALLLPACGRAEPAVPTSSNCFPRENWVVGVDEVVDSAAVASALGPMSAPARVEWSVKHHQDGQVDARRIEGTRSAVIDSLTNVVELFARPYPEWLTDSIAPLIADTADAGIDLPPRTFRLVASRSSSGVLTLSTASPTICRPVLTNRAEIGSLARAAFEEVKHLTGTTLVGVWVDEDGTVVRTEIRRTSGDPVLDAVAVAMVEAALFKPATVDGLPISVRMSFPIMFSGQ